MSEQAEGVVSDQADDEKPENRLNSNDFTTTDQRYHFVKEIESQFLAGKTEAEILKRLTSAGDLKNYYTWKSIRDFTLDDLNSVRTGHGFVDASIRILSKIISSGIFFMLIGGALIYQAIELEGAKHPSFVFILVVLGIAILLYGTGTQAIGDFKNSDTSQAWKANVSLAGGAGVLALLTASGMVVASEPIRQSFLPQQSYAKMTLKLFSENNITYDDGLFAKASFSGEPVPSVYKGGRIVFMIPYEVGKLACDGYLQIELRDTGSGKPVSQTSNYIYKIQNRGAIETDTGTGSVSVGTDKNAIAPLTSGRNCANEIRGFEAQDSVPIRIAEYSTGGKDVKSFLGTFVVKDSILASETEKIVVGGEEERNPFK